MAALINPTTVATPRQLRVILFAGEDVHSTRRWRFLERVLVDDVWLHVRVPTCARLGPFSPTTIVAPIVDLRY